MGTIYQTIQRDALIADLRFDKSETLLGRNPYNETAGVNHYLARLLHLPVPFFAI
jgi:hypothetical protein